MCRQPSVKKVISTTWSLVVHSFSPFPSITGNHTEEAVSVQAFFCEEGSYNDMATLFPASFLLFPSITGNHTEVAVSVQTFFCEEGSYNDMATLFFNPQEVAIRQLFHQQGIFSIPTLGTFFILFFLLACWT